MKDRHTKKISHVLSCRMLLAFIGFYLLTACTPSPAEKASDLEAAEQAYVAGNFSQTLTLAEIVLQEKPDTLAALQLKARANVAQGNIAAALNEHAHIEKQYPELAAALLHEIIIAVIKTSLENENYFVRSAAVKAVGEMGDPGLLPLIIPRMRDQATFVRFFTVESFGQLEGPDFLKLIMAAGQDPDGMVRVAVVKVLTQLGKTYQGLEINKLLSTFEKDLEPTVRLLALSGLSKNGDAAAFLKIVSEIRTLPDEAQVSIVAALGGSKHPDAIQLLTAYSKNDDDMLRMYAMEAMGVIASDKFRPQLEKGLNDEAPSVRGAAATSLGKLGDKDVIPLIKKLLDDVNPMVRLSAAEALKRLGQNHLAGYESALQDPDYGVRHFAVSSLRRTWGVEALPLLRLALKDEAPRVRTAAIRAIGEIGGAESLALIKNSMKDPDLAVRTYAAGNTGRLTNKIAGKTLKSLQGD